MMKKSKRLISEALTTLAGNMNRTGDPLGFKSVYWTEWSKGLDLPREGHTFLFTARMYQMLPYILQATKLISTASPLLCVNGLNRLLRLGNRLAGEKVIRLKAATSGKMKKKGNKALRGIVSALRAVGIQPAYLYEDEPYSGVLLHDLGINGETHAHMKRVHNLLKSRQVKQIIVTDPHTFHMFKNIYAENLEAYDIEVTHYLEILAEKVAILQGACKGAPKEKYVIHDSCVMTRELGFVEPARKVATAIGVDLLEPENAGLNTACCGGPIEYAFGELSEKVSLLRGKELAACSRHIFVNCPICLINLSKYETPLGIRVSDMGELLYDSLHGPGH